MPSTMCPSTQEGRSRWKLAELPDSANALPLNRAPAPSRASGTLGTTRELDSVRLSIAHGEPDTHERSLGAVDATVGDRPTRARE